MASTMELSHAPKNDEDQSWDQHFFTNDPTALTVSPTVPAYFTVQQDSQPVDPNIAPWLSESFNDVIPESVGPLFHPAHISPSAHSSHPGPSTFPLQRSDFQRFLVFSHKAQAPSTHQ